jgi:PIN domain nuclease of toxin-antitoxin system
MLLLDTHAWIWIVDGDARRVGRRARALVAKAAARDALRISAVSLFEIVALHVAGRLRFDRPVERWMDEALALAAVRIAGVAREVAVDAGFIPFDALADPVDRIVAATARHLGATLITADEAVLAYAERTGNVRAHDLRR